MPERTLHLSSTDLAVLDVLQASAGRVLSRGTIQRQAGLDNHVARSCDSAIVSLRRVLGTESIVTVRRRGWMLTDLGLTRAVDVFGPRTAGPVAE